MPSNIKMHQCKNRHKILVNDEGNECNDSIITPSVVRKKHRNTNKEKKMKNASNAEETSLALLEECIMQENETSGDKNCRSVKDKCKEP